MAAKLASPTDLWVAGVKLEDLADDDGALDHAKVEQATEDVLAEHPHWRQPAATAPDLHPGARTPVTRPPSFGDALKKAGRRR